jgi:hypothetical protein
MQAPLVIQTSAEFWCEDRARNSVTKSVPVGQLHRPHETVTSILRPELPNKSITNRNEIYEREFARLAGIQHLRPLLKNAEAG